MFYGSEITNVMQMNAKTMAEGCCLNMYANTKVNQWPDWLVSDNITLAEYCFNNMPDDADGCRFALTWRNMNNIDNYNSFWIIDECYCGAQCYSINNRETMLHYINNMHIKFREADDNSLLEGKNASRSL